MFGFQHWNLETRHHYAGKTLSGGYVPCRATLRGAIFTKRRSVGWTGASVIRRCSGAITSRWLQWTCVAREVIDSENLVANSAKMGQVLMERIDSLRVETSFLKEVRGQRSIDS